jgi:hypothetical protein
MAQRDYDDTILQQLNNGQTARVQNGGTSVFVRAEEALLECDLAQPNIPSFGDPTTCSNPPVINTTRLFEESHCAVLVTLS